MRKIYSFILIAFLSLPVYSQDYQESTSSIIPQIGFNSTKYTSDSRDRGRIGLQIGVNARFGDDIYIQPGLFWMRQHPNIIVEGQSQNLVNNNFDVNSLRLQLLGGYKFRNTTVFSIRGNLGPSLTFITNVKKNEYGITNKDFKNPQLGVIVGAGIDLFFLTLDLNYDIGLSDVFTSNSNATANAFFLNLGVKFDF